MTQLVVAGRAQLYLARVGAMGAASTGLGYGLLAALGLRTMPAAAVPRCMNEQQAGGLYL